jgi:hypothetical protein
LPVKRALFLLNAAFAIAILDLISQVFVFNKEILYFARGLGEI